VFDYRASEGSEVKEDKSSFSPLLSLRESSVAEEEIYLIDYGRKDF